LRLDITAESGNRAWERIYFPFVYISDVRVGIEKPEAELVNENETPPLRI